MQPAPLKRMACKKKRMADGQSLRCLVAHLPIPAAGISKSTKPRWSILIATDDNKITRSASRLATSIDILHDAAIVSTESGSAGGQYADELETTEAATLMTTTRGPGVSGILDTV
eukprot:SAG31_NODE_6375_length_2040_cov_1.503864_2_plen_115_part_00